MSLNYNKFKNFEIASIDKFIMKQNNLSLDINKQGSRYATHKGAQRSNGSILMAAGMKNVDPNSPIKSSGAKMINDGSGTKNHNTSRQDLLLNS